MRRPRRPWLVASSLALHLAAVLGLFIAGFWRLDKLEAERRHISLAVSPPPPPLASGGPASVAAPVLHPKRVRRIVREAVQPEPRPPEDTPEVAPETATTEAASGTGAGTGSGDGRGRGHGSGDTPGTPDGSCETSPCGAPRPEPPRPPPPAYVPPTVIQGLRIAGETQLHPPDPVKTAMLRDGKSRVVAMLEVCLDARGAVSRVTPRKSSGYPAYDAVLLQGARAWRYRPYAIGGRPVPVCGIVTFIYAIH